MKNENIMRIVRKTGWMLCVVVVVLCSCSSSKHAYKKRRKPAPCDCPKFGYVHHFSKDVACSVSTHSYYDYHSD